MNTERRPLSITTPVIDKKGRKQYTIKSVLGYGGTAITYKCASSDGGFYCLKELYPTELADCLIREADGRIVMNPIFGDKHQKTLDWYIRNLIEEEKKHRLAASDSEAEANDPYFLRSYGTFTAENGNLYALYDMKKGIALSQSIDSLSPVELLSVMITACKKLHRLHSGKKMLHLDLSPANIYLVENVKGGSEAYFLDFGSALPMDAPDVSSHRFSATEGYSAQEILARAEGNHSAIYKIGAHSDTYSLAAILFRALVGETYSIDHRLDPHLWMSKVREKLSACGAERAADSLIGIIRKGLDQSEYRYRSANELFDDLCAAYGTITGDSTELVELINDIETRIKDFERAVMQRISDTAEEIKAHTERDGNKTRRYISKLATCLAAALILIVGAFLFIEHTDFVKPRIILQDCQKNEEDYVVDGDFFECILKVKDNKELEHYDVTVDDLIFDGFECIPSIERFSDGTYLLTLANIKREADTAQLIIKAGCAEDEAKNESGETRFTLVFADKPGDSTPPSVVISKPISALGRYLIPVGGDLILWVSLDDNTGLKSKNVTEELIHTDVEYDGIKVETVNESTYKVTLFNVRGSDGEHRVYFSPGLAIDKNNNYSLSVEMNFYLYSDEESIDNIAPEIKISSPTVSDEAVEYRLEITDNMGIRDLRLSARDITPVGFSADISIVYVSNSAVDRVVRIIRFTNVRSTSDDSEKYFIINSGIATDRFGNRTSGEISPSFTFTK